MLSYFEHKTSYLSRHPARTILPAITRSIAEVLTAHRAAQPSSVFRQALELELSYSMLRHLEWHGSPVLHGMVTAFLCDEFKLPLTVAESLVDGASRILVTAGYALKSSDGTEDLNFLHYVFVACATAPDEHSLAADLGLGQGLIARVRQATAGLAPDYDATRGAPELALGPELDFAFQQLMIDTAAELRIVSWILDEHRLRYHLATPSFDRAATRRLFHLLRRIGTAGTASAAEIAHWQAEELAAGDAPIPIGKTELLTLLSAKELIYSAPGRRPQNHIYHLAHLGQEITAEGFAHSFIAAALDFALIPYLPPPYQRAVVIQLPRERDNELYALLSSEGALLAPTTLAALTRRLAKRLPHDDLAAALGPLARSASHWQKPGVCESFQALNSSDSAGLALAEMAESDPSQRVREAARSHLTLWNEARQTIRP